MALQNLPQTFRGRERSKRGYACGATALTEKNRDDSFELRMESGGLHAQFEGIITVLLR